MPLVGLSEPDVATHILRVYVRFLLAVAPIPRAWGLSQTKNNEFLIDSRVRIL